MTEKVDVQILKDQSGFPVQAIVKKRNRTLTALYTNNGKISLKGDLSLADNLKMIYPFQEKTVLSIPQPLQTVSVSGGKIILYDNMEDLLKWVGILAGVAVDALTAYNGNQSLGVTNDDATRTIPTVHNYLVKFNFYMEAGVTALGVWIDYVRSTQGYEALFSYTAATGTWQYLNLAGAATTIHTEIISGQYWHSFEMCVREGIYQYVKIDNVKTEIKQPLYFTGVGPFTLGATITLSSTAGESNFDDVQIIEVD